MQTTATETESLFSYGTLQLPAVQQANFGRLLRGRADALPGWRKDWVEVTDAQVLAQSGQRFHPIVRRTGAAADRVEGMVFAVTPAELAQADAYEVEDYARALLPMASGARAWVYVARAELKAGDAHNDGGSQA